MCVTISEALRLNASALATSAVRGLCYTTGVLRKPLSYKVTASESVSVFEGSVGADRAEQKRPVLLGVVHHWFTYVRLS